MKNIKLTVQYNGKNYPGWQSQPGTLGIEGEIERAYFTLFSEKIKIHGSGRTDSGVHALGQVCNFHTERDLDPVRLPKALNCKLPKDVSVVDAEEVAPDFHSRYHAKGKCYRYLMYNSLYRNPVMSGISYQVKFNLDFEKMRSEMEKLKGRHDFSTFMSAKSSVKTTTREIYDIRLEQRENIIVLEIEGSGFLYNMVRIIVGTLVDIGRGRITDSMEEIIASKDRGKAGHTAPAWGLYLKEVYY
ncbi:MAG: tRNA pseudouridine(38-40) synthase TruA [Clostridioides sp.]|jgi:tRNA pseudouridine38-40 synthase|nr:tRNA pseudouridine(38-40) synthase TruA [Clostridioides sp.]